MLACLMVLMACQQRQTRKLNIAVAANMQFAIKELSRAFTSRTGVPCELIVSSSGKLTAQIKAGAPFDVFLSADMKYPVELFKTGFATKAPQIYAYGELVIWTMKEGIPPALATLKNPAIRHVALSNPEMAPYGAAAMEVLKRAGLYEHIKDKLVYGESISQTNQFIISKSAEIGFTAKSVVLSPEIKGKGTWMDINKNSYSPIAQGVVLIKQDDAEQNDAEKFLAFLLSAEARKILKDHGYSVKQD